MQTAAGDSFRSSGDCIHIDFGAGLPARIDGTVGQSIAAEVESRVSKQVRGAVLDLICHPYPKKLLVLLPVHMSNPKITKLQCEHILLRFLSPDAFRVVVANGSGFDPRLDEDAALVRAALMELERKP